MKVQLLLPMAIAISVIMVGVMKIRKKEHEKEQRKSRFQEIKLRMTYDVLTEYQNEKIAKQQQLESAEKEQKTLDEELLQILTNVETAKKDMTICVASKKTEQDVMDLVDKDFSEVKASTEKERMEWMTETDSLKKQLEAPSPVCAFLRPDTQAASKLCGEAAPKLEEAKAEAPKPEEAKAEAPKQEEAKAEAPKAEAPKEEAKAEAPKAEAPKQEEAKAEAPKAEAPKQEEAKAEAPKQEEAKPEAPKAEAPKQEEAKAEAPKAEAPKEEAKAEAPKKR